MDGIEILKAISLGILEGATEFIPVSSTGHLLLAGHFMGFSSPTKSFEIMIQLGSILAVISVYMQKILSVLKNFKTSPQARNFVLGLIIAFLPSVIVGVTIYKYIKEIFMMDMYLICFMLIIGGVILILMDKRESHPVYIQAEEFSLKTYLVIGLCQCLAMIPGVSRSGATIVSGMLMGADRRSAAEFSFFLAIPTMLAAFIYDFYKNAHAFRPEDFTGIGIGFVFAFISAFVVVRTVLSYVSRHGFKFFGWWRILVGGFGLLGLYFLG